MAGAHDGDHGSLGDWAIALHHTALPAALLIILIAGLALRQRHHRHAARSQHLGRNSD